MNKILEAIYFASGKHVNQKRKGTQSPYISHPLAVALILSQVTNDQNIIIAGILHDTVEDTDTSYEEIEKIFGQEVTGLVKECTEDTKDEDWSSRKRKVLEKIPSLSHHAALVKSADILHNSYEIIERLKEKGMQFFENFNIDAGKKVEYEIRRLELLKKYHPNNLLVDVGINIAQMKEFLKR